MIRRFTIFLSLMFMLVTLSGCGSDEQKKSEEDLRVGTITQLNTTPAQMNQYIGQTGVNVVTTYYDNISSMLMALSSKKIDAMQTYSSVANYMAHQNSGVEVSKTVNLFDAFCCAMRDDEEDLKTAFDVAILSMTDDGTLDALTKTYITDLESEPAPVEIAYIDGADTIKVGVTGDLPPLDFISADGKPAGFNTAVLSEISKRIEKNISLVQIDSAARAAALTSNQVDVVFWVVVPADDSDRPVDMDRPAGIVVTTPYYQDQVVDVSITGAFSGMGN